MRGLEAFRVAWEALRANRLRSLLTMLGVIIGVSSVVLLVSIGSGVKREVEAQVQGLGSNLMFIVPGEFTFAAAPTSSRMQLDDVEMAARIVGNPRNVTAQLVSGETISVGSESQFATVVGTTENAGSVFDRELLRGRHISRTDVDARRRVVVLGYNVGRNMFGGVDPLGRQISVAGVRFRVIGVYDETGAAFGVSRDDQVYLPVTTAQRLLSAQRVDALVVKSPTIDRVEELQSELVAALEERYTGEEFSAMTQTQILGTIGVILGMLTAVLAAIAGISLVVGGVGVSNIMLVSVRERTREIGLRKALGARQRDILRQFLIEAVLLTTVGGVIGILFGVAVSLTLDAFSPLPALITWWSPALAFGVSVAVGVFFGVAPARRAGKLDPVVALRTE